MSHDSSYNRRGSANLLLVLVCISVALLIGLLGLLYWIGQTATSSPNGTSSEGCKPLTIFCAAGLRYPLDQIVADYTTTYGRPVSVQYGGSNTMLSQLTVGKNADLYIAADDSYTQLAEERNMVRERFPLASQRPVIVVRKQNPLDITTVSDLPGKQIRYAIGDPEATAIGKKTKQALEKTGAWE